MAEKRIDIMRPGMGDKQTAQTPGMEREALFTTPNAWVGMVHTKPEFVSGWHHHGEYEPTCMSSVGRSKLNLAKPAKKAVSLKRAMLLLFPKTRSTENRTRVVKNRFYSE